MLTREEADRLYLILGGMVVDKGAKCRCLMNWHKAQQEILNLTEKPKPEIKLENIVKAIQVLANVVGGVHAGNDYPHGTSFCGFCESLEVVDELLEGKDE